MSACLIRCLLYELLTGEFLFVYTVWAEFFVQLTSSTARILPPERMAPLRKALSPQVYSMVERLLEYMLVRSADRRPRVDMVRRQLQLVVQAISKKINVPPPASSTQPLPQTTAERRQATASKEEEEQRSPKSRKLAGLNPHADKMWIPNSSSLTPASASSALGDGGEGMWRLSPDLYLASVARWDTFLQQSSSFNFHELMAELDLHPIPGGAAKVSAADKEGHALLAPAVAVKSDDPVMHFNAAFLPDLWTERQWLRVQRVPAYHVGITRVLFVTEVASSSHHAASTPPLLLVEKDLKDVEVLISLQKSLRLTVGGINTAQASTTTNSSRHRQAAGGTGSSASSSSSGGGKAAGSGDKAAGSGDKTPGSRGSTLQHGRTPACILQINSRTDGSSTADWLAKALATDATAAAALERVADFLVTRDSTNRGCGVIVTSADDRPPSSLPNLLASAIAALCGIRGGPSNATGGEAPPCLYETILRVKSAYPRLALTPQFVALLHKAFAKKHAPPPPTGAGRGDLSSRGSRADDNKNR